MNAQAAAALATLCWLLSAGVYIAAKAVVTEMPPWSLCFWRVLMAGLILLPITRPHWSAMIALIQRRWLSLLIVGGLGLSITQGLIYVGLNYTTAINAGLIIALMPVITMILARFLLNEPVGTWQFIGSIIAFVVFFANVCFPTIWLGRSSSLLVFSWSCYLSLGPAP